MAILTTTAAGDPIQPWHGVGMLKLTKNNKIKICVKDEGIGMSGDDKKHLFERFYRGTNATNIQGTGLGLHIVGKYIELMDGSITIKSKLEEGTEIIVTFHV